MASFYDQTVQNWKDKPVDQLVLADLLPCTEDAEVTQEEMIKSAVHVRASVAIRVAKRIDKMQHLPFVVGISPPMHTLFNLYHVAFTKLIQKPEPTNAYQEREMTLKLFPTLLSSTEVVLPTLAAASKALEGVLDKDDINLFFDSMLTGRIYRRTLVANHMHLNSVFEKRKGDDLGGSESRGLIITPNTDITNIARNAFTEFTRPIILERYGVCPEIVVTSRLQKTISYIPRHIEIMLIELFKNACCATIEKHGNSHSTANDFSTELPPISLSVFVSDLGDTTIKISDCGGGFQGGNHAKDAAFDYANSTWRVDPDGGHRTDHSNVQEYPRFAGGTLARAIAGEGFGLPLVEQYASFFGGDVHVQPVVGYGTDVYLRLRDLGVQNPNEIIARVDF